MHLIGNTKTIYISTINKVLSQGIIYQTVDDGRMNGKLQNIRKDRYYTR